MICTDFYNQKRHDFSLFKASRITIHPDTKIITNTGYQAIQTPHKKSELPKKKE